jgi:hypothetical protein
MLTTPGHAIRCVCKVGLPRDVFDERSSSIKVQALRLVWGTSFRNAVSGCGCRFGVLGHRTASREYAAWFDMWFGIPDQRVWTCLAPGLWHKRGRLPMTIEASNTSRRARSPSIWCSAPWVFDGSTLDKLFVTERAHSSLEVRLCQRIVCCRQQQQQQQQQRPQWCVYAYRRHRSPSRLPDTTSRRYTRFKTRSDQDIVEMESHP